MTRTLLTLILLGLCASLGHSATVAMYNTERVPTPIEIQAEPTLGSKTIFEFFVTSDADVLSVDNVEITGSLFQVPFGSDVEPPLPAFLPVFPHLSADSWITTPGATSVAGGGFANPLSAWFDVSNDGPVSDFMFARLTVPTAEKLDFTFRGRMSVAGDTGVENFRFFFLVAIPEPSAALMTAVALAIGAFRWRSPSPPRPMLRV